MLYQCLVTRSNHYKHRRKFKTRYRPECSKVKPLKVDNSFKWVSFMSGYIISRPAWNFLGNLAQKQLRKTIYICQSHNQKSSVLFFVFSVLWHCWLGGRKGIRPVKNWVVRCWHGYLSGASRCRCHCQALSVASVKSRLVFPFWYRLTQVVPEKGR